MANTKTATSTFPFLGILALIFITLKLCSVITWSWWWVLAPLWGPLAIVLAVFLIVAIVAGILKILSR